MPDQQSPRTYQAFTLLELLVVVAIIGVLAAMLLPIIGTVRQQARQVECLSNIRQSMLAISAYAADNHGIAPPTDDCVWAAKPVVKGIQLRHWTEFLVCLEYIENRDGAITIGSPWPDTIAIAKWPNVIGCSVFRPKYLPINSAMATNFGMVVNGSDVAWNPHTQCYRLASFNPDRPFLADAVSVDEDATIASFGVHGGEYSLQLWGMYGLINLIHRGRASIAFTDGRVESLDQAALTKLGIPGLQMRLP